MLQASVSGVVDFTAAIPTDPHWWRTLWLKLDAWESFRAGDYYRSHAQLVLQLICRRGNSAEAQESLATRYEDCLHKWVNATFPWLDTGSRSAPVTTQLHDLWVQTFGDPNDPAVKAKIDATVAAMLA